MKEFRQEECKIIDGQLFKYNDFVSIYEIKDLDKNNDNCLRFYKSSPKGYTLQLRTFEPIGQYGDKGKQRNMIANISLQKKDIEALLNFVNKQ